MWLIFLELFIIIIIFKQFYTMKHSVHFNNISIDKKKFFNFDNGNKSSKSITISLLYLFYIISIYLTGGKLEKISLTQFRIFIFSILLKKETQGWGEI